MLGSIYHIPEDHPIKFTHLYLPRSRFDRVVFDGRWIFVQAGNGLSAIWCSEILVPCNDMLFECEMRANSRDSAYFVLCAGLPEYEALEDFIAYAKGIGPAFEYTYDFHAGYEARLWLQGKEFLKWEKGSDATQVIQ